jgi:adenosylmethionine-8-amino-7-oxononanoate aminotransferase
LDAAIKGQLKKISHCSFLGLTNDIAPFLAARLVKKMRSPKMDYKVFFSDDGSTAMEAALKIAVQARLQRNEPHRNRFISLGGGYHGDTVGAMSLSHTPQFHKPFEKIIFETSSFTGPHCYRCPHNRALPTRNCDQRNRRDCSFECYENFDRFLGDNPQTISAMVMEPRVQGAAGMWMHPPGFLAHVATQCRKHGIWLILDEVMTGFGRTGAFFACQKERVAPDFMVLAKGLTGGYLPLAATIVTGDIFNAFLGEQSQRKTFLHGHSYAGNPLGCAAGLANLDIFDHEDVMTKVNKASGWLRRATKMFWKHPNVGDIRQEGMICAIELVADAATRKPFNPDARTGFRVSRAAQKYGLLTRPVADTLVLMPPYCVTKAQISSMVNALWAGLCDVLPLKFSEN